jgi:hypothetical protein
MEPSWMIAVAIVIIAALPHQLPIPISWGLKTPIGRMLGLVVSVAVAYYKPVLGMALAILFISTNISKYVEGFSSRNEGFTQSITKDKVEKKHLWKSEEVMLEEPEAIQERSETVLLKDMVTDQDAQPWLGERIMGEEPKGVQERSMQTHAFQETEYSAQNKHGN